MLCQTRQAHTTSLVHFYSLLQTLQLSHFNNHSTTVFYSISSPHLHSHLFHALVRAKNTWKFEYTGDPEPQMESAWGEPSDERGSEGYKKMMAQDVFGDESFSSDMMQRRPACLATERRIPVNCTVDEVMIAVKAAMFEISDWLLEVEVAEQRRNSVLDGDLSDDYSYGDGDRDRSLGDYRGEHTDSRDGQNSGEGGGSGGGGGGGGSGGGDSGGRGKGGGERFSFPPCTSRSTRSESHFRRILEEDEEEESEDGGDAEDDDDDTAPPPLYEEEGDHPPPFSSPSRPLSSISSRGLSLSRHTPPLHTPKPPTQGQDRVSVIFRAFVNAQNNKAKWLGKNEKLTRLKFQGGIERVLRLKMTWQQFDTLWTKLDSTRSGDLDVKEFRDSFGGINDFDSVEGM